MPYLDFNRPRFLQLAYTASSTAHTRFNIGTYKEKTLHRVLKDYFTDKTAQQEVPVDRFVADVYTPDGIIEIQTSGLSSMRDKLEAFLPIAPVTVVFPVAVQKWISWIDPVSGDIGKKNRSHKKGKPFDAVPEMIYIKPYLRHKKLTVRVVLLEIEEYRLLNGRRSLSRKRGSTRFERMPVDIFGIDDFHTAEDFIGQIPLPRDAEFTSRELASALKYRGGSISAILHVLMEVGAVYRTEKKGNAYLYRFCAPEA